MGVRLTLDSDWWVTSLREFDTTKKQFKEDIKGMLLESGDILNKEIEKEIHAADAFMDEEAQQKFSKALQCRITRATDLYIVAEAGLLFDKYDEKNPATGVKALWLNYGTKVRFVKTGTKEINVNGRSVNLNTGVTRGYIRGGYFINKARKAAAKKIHALQVKRVNEALDRFGAEKNRRPIIQ